MNIYPNVYIIYSQHYEKHYNIMNNIDFPIKKLIYVVYSMTTRGKINTAILLFPSFQ